MCFNKTEKLCIFIIKILVNVMHKNYNILLKNRNYLKKMGAIENYEFTNSCGLRHLAICVTLTT